MIVIRSYPYTGANIVFAATCDFASVPWVWQTSPNPPTVSGTPVDLTGFTAAAIIFANYDDAAPLVSLTDVLSDEGQIVLGGTAGTVQLVLTHATTSSLPSDSLRWTLRLTSPFPALLQTVLLTGSVQRLPIGPLT
jgi:hypothetical protein